MYSTPILVIIYNRPDFTEKLYAILSKIKPLKLYVVSDGARNKEEQIAVNKSREIFNLIDWNCDVSYNYSDVNLGLRERISGGISWAFEAEERLIIIEDDCLPSKDFFEFCDSLLNKYENDKSVMTINGCNLNPSQSSKIEYSYFFSNYSNSWGWATWKRAWNLYDSDLKGFKNKQSLKKTLSNLPFKFRALIYWNYKLNLVKKEKINSWAYRWMFTLWNNNGLAIVPKSNLIKNVGTDSRSSNTQGNLHYLNINTSSLNLRKINHPKKIQVNSKYDKWLENSIYSKSVKYRFIWVFKKVTFQI